VVVDWPSDGVLVGASLVATGWAIGPADEHGTGVDAVRAYLDGPAGSGVPVGRATYGLSRPDVALALRDSRYTLSGWRIEADLPAGTHRLHVYAHPAGQPEDEGWAGPVQVVMRVDGGAGPGILAAMEPSVLATPGAAACGGRELGSAPCAAAAAAAPGNCAVPDRDSGRCLMRNPTNNPAAPAAGVPGSWNSYGTGAGSNGPTGASSAATPPAAAAPPPPGSSVLAVDATTRGMSTAVLAASYSGRPGATLTLSTAQLGSSQVQLNWNGLGPGSSGTYEIRRCASMSSAASTCQVVATVQAAGYRLMQGQGVYYIRAVGPSGLAEGESNRVQVCCGG
jgi:hypothetical protein